MRIFGVTLVALLVIAGTAQGNDKITPIKGVLLICAERSVEPCPEKIFDRFIMASPIKFLTRKHLDLLLQEQQFQLSGMTDRDKSVKIGRLLGASHLLLYAKEAEEPFGNRALLIRLQLINVQTSEIEYTNIIRWHGNEDGDRYVETFFQLLASHKEHR